MLLTKEVEITLGSHNIKMYEDLGYNIPKVLYGKKLSVKRGTKIKIKVEHIKPTSRVNVEVRCDYCGYIFDKEYYLFVLQRKTIQKDCCNDVECMKKKRNESNLLTYGYENQFARPEIKEKIIQYYLDNFGVKYNTLTENFVEKTQASYKERLGVINNSQTTEWLEKVKQTSIKNWGVEFPFQSEEIKEKIKCSLLLKYGVENALKNPYIKQKMMNSMYKNGSGICSEQQKYLHNILKGELNYPEGNVFIDIAFVEPKIAIEYNGGGHDLSVKHGSISKEDFLKKEMRRQYFLFRRGWRIIRIVSNKDRLPNIEKIYKVIIKVLEYFLTGRHWFEINIDEGKLKCSQYEIDYDFGELFYIK